MNIALIILAVVPSDDSATNAAAPIKALLVTGGCCHDYDTQQRLIPDGLSARIPITFDVVDGGDTKEEKLSLYDDPDWANGYDIIVHNECFGAVEDADFVEGIVNAHRNGVPGVFIHCSMHSYREAGEGAEAWRDLLGAKSVRHESKHPVHVVPITEHPVLTEFPDVWGIPKGELYVIDEIGPRTTVLATAMGTDTGREHPVVWINEFGKTRVFVTTAGHFNETINTDVWMGVVSRGILWTLKRIDDEGNDTGVAAGGE